jgi:hypothetical protein
MICASLCLQDGSSSHRYTTLCSIPLVCFNGDKSLPFDSSLREEITFISLNVLFQCLLFSPDGIGGHTFSHPWLPTTCRVLLPAARTSGRSRSLSFQLTVVIRWAVLPSNEKLPACASSQMQAFSIMEVAILVFPSYAKIMVSFKFTNYAANTYSVDTYVKNNHEEEVFETFMSQWS